MSRPGWPILRRLLTYFAPYKWGLGVALVLMSIHGAIPGVLVFLIEKVLDDVLIQQDRTMLMALPFAVFGLYALNGGLGFARGMLTRSIAWKVVTTLRAELFAAQLGQDAAWHQSTPTGQKVSRLTNDVTQIELGVSGIVTAVQKPITLVVLIGSAFVLNPKLAIITVVLLPFVAIPIQRFGRRLRQKARASFANLAGLTASSTETLTGIRTVQAFGGEAQRLAVFEAENQAQYRLQMQAYRARLLPSPIIELVAATAVGIVIWVGGRQVFSGEIEPGELLAFMVALGLLNDPLKGLAEVNSMAQRAIAGASAVFSVLDRPSAVPDRGTTPLPSGPLDLQLKGVDFDYGDGPVLQQIDLHVPAGGVVALVGASGAGKSTIAGLVPRFFDPTAGSVELGGIDLREVPLANLRSHVAVVSQEPFLFDDTVAGNIALGLDPTPPLGEIEAAARAANAHDFIAGLPKGYQTRIDELGLRLSGGQRQRICIARAILRNAPVLVLDEATSALDAESEALVTEALVRLMADRTVLAIAHRLSTIRDADELIVLDHGRVVERGTHDALMAAGGVYAQLVRRQA